MVYVHVYASAFEVDFIVGTIIREYEVGIYNEFSVSLTDLIMRIAFD